MINLDVSLEYAIFSKAYREALENLKKDLAKRSHHIKMIFEKDGITKDLIDRANREQEYLKKIVEYISTAESLINILLSKLNNLQGLQIDWHEEYLRECKAHQEFVEMIILKYNKIKNG